MRRVLLIGASVLATAGIVAGSLFGGMEGGDVWWPVTWIVWAPVGTMVLLKRPGNGVGVSMLVTGLLWGLGFLFLALAQSDLPLEVRVWADLMTALLGVVSWLGIIWLILVFPSGRLDGRLARATAVGFTALGALAVYAFTVTTEPMDATGLPSPLASEQLSRTVDWLVDDNGFFLVIALVVLAIVSAGQRWYRSDGVERHQYRWLLFGALVFVLTLAMGQVVPEDSSGLYLWLLAGAAIPLSVGVAIIRYRLYEIDRLISRTLGYAVVVVLLGSLFALGVVAIPNIVIGAGGSAPPLVVAASTLAVAALFNPVRRRVLRWVDRRFNRSRYDTERVMDEFAGSLRDQTDADEVVNGWVGVVSETMEPVSMAVWVR